MLQALREKTDMQSYHVYRKSYKNRGPGPSQTPPWSPKSRPKTKKSISSRRVPSALNLFKMTPFLNSQKSATNPCTDRLGLQKGVPKKRLVGQASMDFGAQERLLRASERDSSSDPKKQGRLDEKLIKFDTKNRRVRSARLCSKTAI